MGKSERGRKFCGRKSRLKKLGWERISSPSNKKHQETKKMHRADLP